MSNEAKGPYEAVENIHGRWSVTGPLCGILRAFGHDGDAAKDLASELNDAHLYAHTKALASQAARVKELEEALLAVVLAFESGWPSHATESIGGLGHMPGESCNACRMMPAYSAALSALTPKEPQQ